MMPNFLVLLASALIPFFIAYIWFHKSLFGGEKWHTMSDMPATKTSSPVKPIKLLLSIVLNVLLAFGIYKTGTAEAFLDEYGGRFHTLTHGLAHGVAATLFYALPLLGYVVIFEKKSAKYFWVYLGYWFISMTLMSIVICLWGTTTI
jgi:hypothetical protein